MGVDTRLPAAFPFSRPCLPQAQSVTGLDAFSCGILLSHVGTLLHYQSNYHSNGLELACSTCAQRIKRQGPGPGGEGHRPGRTRRSDKEPRHRRWGVCGGEVIECFSS